MTEAEVELSVEEKIAVVDSWVESLSNYDENGNVEIAELDRGIIKDVLQEFGADFEIQKKPELKALWKYTNKGRRKGMNAAWGKGRMGSYNYWTSQWVDVYEMQSGKKLPALKPSGIKTAGPRHFLGELTAYAAKLPFELYSTYLQARLKNGWLWNEERKDERIKVMLPTDDQPKLLASIPPSFVEDAWKEIKSWG
ncbi:MAG: hypothetical protein ACC618_02795 [Patescibacteria group bacterium]